MAYFIINAAMMLVMLPVLVIQTRIFLYRKQRAWERGDRRQLFETLLEQLPHDLAIIGMTLSFASNAGAPKGALGSGARTLFIVAPLLPFFVMTVLPILGDKRLRIALGLLGYFVGVTAFLLSWYFRGV